MTPSKFYYLAGQSTEAIAQALKQELMPDGRLHEEKLILILAGIIKMILQDVSVRIPVEMEMTE